MTSLWVGTSWKMSKTLGQARTWVQAVTAQPVPAGVTAFVLPSHTALATVRDLVPPDHGLVVGAQDAHWSTDVAWTGEVSAAQVADAGARLVEVGHSERRDGLGEGDDVVARKVRAVLDAGLTPLLCVGEHAAAREAGAEIGVVEGQLRSALDALAAEDRARVLLAYEPVWSIGEHGTPATAGEIGPVVEALVAAGCDLTAGAGLLAVLYGGSVTPANAAGLLAVPGVDGLFAGRSAWEAAGFLELVRIAGEAVDQLG